jgi:hypothetical protein
MGWPGRAQRTKTTVEQDGEASKLKELTMRTHQKSANPIATPGVSNLNVSLRVMRLLACRAEVGIERD